MRYQDLTSKRSKSQTKTTSYLLEDSLIGSEALGGQFLYYVMEHQERPATCSRRCVTIH